MITQATNVPITSTRKAARPVRQPSPAQALTWPTDTELVGIVLELAPAQAYELYPQYTIGLHAWFLDQIRQMDPQLSALMHDEQAEKAFTISGLEGSLLTKGRSFQVQAGQTYRWTITALSQQVAQGLAQWLSQLPPVVELRGAPLPIKRVAIALPPTTYATLWATGATTDAATLSFVSPTSFRRRGQHFPLPVPANVFHSYLRRWNAFADVEYDSDLFWEWVEDTVLVLRHRLESMKVIAGKKGVVTAFTGAVEFGLSPKAQDDLEFEQLFYTLVQLAPYCGTGHKTTFGLGQTRLGWQLAEPPHVPSMQTMLVERIAELTDLFIAQRQRTGGDRASNTAETWATILARRELGESLQDVAADLSMNYETVKTYVKLARRALKESEL